MDASTEAERRFRVGQVYFNAGNYVSAIRELDAAIVAYEQVPDYPGKAASLNTIGHSYVALGRVDLAARYFEDSLKINMAFRNMRGIAEVGLSLGAAWVDLGRYESARPLLEQVIGIFQQLGDMNGLAAANQNLQNCF
jgi:tetratricopeptide (TPR) repeat protein